MPIVTSSAPAIVNLAVAIESMMSESAGPARATVGARSQAFDWTEGLPPWAGTVFSGVLVEGLVYRSTIVSPSGTPAARVAAGAPKPNAATITATTHTLPKYAGYADVNTEELIDTEGLVTAIESVLLDQALAAFSVDVAAALDGAALSATGASWAEAVLNGIGVLPTADVLVSSPADVAALLSPSSGYQIGMRDAIPTVFGLGLVMLPGLASGKAYVSKSSALTLFESGLSPAVLVDPYSQSTNNIVRVVADLFAAAELTAPGACVEITVAGP